ncbi:MAG: 30S ribosomal protein S6--L-glutamate ligase [Acidiferrobacter sp.]|nr:30S ribosomal protein S6--L-glutamate ligase [Acidiferrobacter sp.]
MSGQEPTPRAENNLRGKELKGGSWAAQTMEPRLVLLSRGPELYSTRRLATEAQRAGWMVDIIDPLALTIIVDEDGGRIFHRGWPVECEAVLPRIGYSITRRGVAIVRQFEQLGVIVLNSSHGIVRSRDKLVACQMMAQARVPVPITAHVGSWEDTDRAVRRVGGTPCVVKSTEGTHGSGVFLVNSSKQARQLVYQMLERGMRPLVQEYIEESHGSDVRALVVGGEVVASMRRKAHGNEFRSNFHLGGSVSDVELTEEQAEIAIDATRTLGLELAGVDMLESERGPLVLEVNSSPGLEGIEGATRVNVAGKVAERLNSLLEEGSDANVDSEANPLDGSSDESSRAY